MFVVRLLTIGSLSISLAAFCMEKPFGILKEVNGKEKDATTIVQTAYLCTESFYNLKEVHLHNAYTKELSVPDIRTVLGNLISFSLTNTKIKMFDLEAFLVQAPNLTSLDLSNNKKLSHLIIYKYHHKNLGYIGLNNTGLSTDQVIALKELINKTSNSKKPLIAAQSYTFNMPKVTHSSPELAKQLPYVPSLYNE